MKIDQLPVEMLMKIFSYIPKCGELLQVNKLFSDIGCKVLDSNICLHIDRQFFERFICHNNVTSEWQQSIQTSNRQITNVEIEGSMASPFLIGELRLINSVIKRFSATIKVLKLISVATDEFGLSETLSLTPNVECLELYDLRYSTVDQSSNKRRCNDELNLKKLRSLMACCDLEFFPIYNRLPEGVLTQLEIFCQWNTLAMLLNRQLNLKKLVLRDHNEDHDDKLDGSAMDIFGKLKLESLEIHHGNKSRVTIGKVLSKLTALKSLVLGGSRENVDDRVMNAIGNQSELEELSIDVTETLVASLINIRKLKKLHNLELECHEEATAQLRLLAESDNTSLKRLSLRISAQMSANVIKSLAKSAPNLTYVKFSRYYALDSTEQKAIVRHFNFVESLVIPSWKKSLADPHGHYFNPKLSELEIKGGGSTTFQSNDMTTLMAAYPNIRRLKISTIWANLSVEVRPILNGFTKLESLTLQAHKLLVQDLNYLNDHTGHLKFVSLGKLITDTLTDELVWKLSTRFMVHVKCYSDGSRFLNMAVDRHTMSCECKLFPLNMS